MGGGGGDGEKKELLRFTGATFLARALLSGDISDISNMFAVNAFSQFPSSSRKVSAIAQCNRKVKSKTSTM